jgi:hypothetical protein
LFLGLIRFRILFLLFIRFSLLSILYFVSRSHSILHYPRDEDELYRQKVHTFQFNLT